LNEHFYLQGNCNSTAIVRNLNWQSNVFWLKNSFREKLRMQNNELLPIAVAILIGIPAFGSCVGIGLAAMKLLEGIARQPELAPEMQTKFFVVVGVLDGAFIIATGIGLWFATANPFK
jgi:F-type H+-transporting ATPase subunit c